MIVVTGGAGFIGSNLVAGLNRRGYTDILVVDDLLDGDKFVNLVDLPFLTIWIKTTSVSALPLMHSRTSRLFFIKGRARIRRNATGST